MAITTTHNKTSFNVGDTIRVHHRFKEGDKTQSQIFEGTVIAIKNRGQGKSFTVRTVPT